MMPNTSNPGERGGYEAQPQPVAYDKDGNPLYAQPQFVHLARAVDPLQPPISAEVQKHHDRAVKKFPQLNLSESEYILLSVRRHPIGLFKIWASGLLFVIAFMVIYFLAFLGPGASSGIQDFSGIAASVLAVIVIMVCIGVFVATYVYVANRFYLTNESVIQEIQTSLFSKNEQTVSLSNIEDASYKQDGVLALIFNYGTLRLSTEGDETTYRFSYVANPKHHIAVLNNAIEAFKNGRPVGMPDPHDDQPS